MISNSYVSDKPNNFRTDLGADIFRNKYASSSEETWLQRCTTVVDDVCGTRGGTTHPLLSRDERRELVNLMHKFMFIPGGRYIYYGGRDVHFYNNCMIYKGEEDTRQEWGRLLHSCSDALMSGAGVGVDYSVFRERGALLRRTGGTASGPLPLAHSINEMGRGVQQGGSRRSAIYGSLNWQHPDAPEWLKVKDWANATIPGTSISFSEAKRNDFDAKAPLDFTNISLNYDNKFLSEISSSIGKSYGVALDPTVWASAVEKASLPSTFVENTRMALYNGEPGFSFNFFGNEKETGRNAPVHPDTWIYTSTGYKQVKDVVGVPIHVWTGKQYAATTFSKTRENDDVVRVVMTGRRAIVSSKDHEFLLANGARVQAQDLVPGMELMQSPPASFGGVAEPNAYLLAFCYGDGYFNNKKSSAEIPLVGKKELVIHKLLGLPCSTNTDKRGIKRIYYRKNRFFAGRTKDVFPNEVYSWDYASRAEFLAGLLDSDGNDYAGFARLSSAKKDFLLGVMRLCDSLGLSSVLNKGTAGAYKGTPTWTLIIRGALSFLPVVRLNLVDVAPSKYKVVEVEEAGTSDVFCCDVGVAEHSFMANGVIISNCTEVTSEDDSDVCNLGSVNMAACSTLEQFRAAVELGSKFLVCGTIRGDLPDEKVRRVREKNRRLGLGLMGIHEWLLQRGHSYEVNEEFRSWLSVYETVSEDAANEHCDRFYLNRPVAYRAIAPNGTIGTMAGTTTGIEPIFAVAYKRRYIEGNRETGVEKRKFQYYIDSAAKDLMDRYSVPSDKIETALSLAQDPEKRIKFQADIQDYVDMAISSTLNLPAWGSEENNEGRIEEYARIIAKYAPRLRGLTCYPDGSRGGQPLVSVPLEEALAMGTGVAFEENSERACKSGVCGI